MSIHSYFAKKTLNNIDSKIRIASTLIIKRPSMENWNKISRNLLNNWQKM